MEYLHNLIYTSTVTGNSVERTFSIKNPSGKNALHFHVFNDLFYLIKFI